MRTLRGVNSNLQMEKSKSKNKLVKDLKDSVDDDIGANGDETTDDEGGVDTPPPPQDDDDDSKGEENGKVNKEESAKADVEYEVEQIVDMQVQKRKKCPVQFRIRWLGFTEKDDTWVPSSELNCQKLVEDFLEISGRKSEYEKAFESKKKAADSSVESFRQSFRKVAKIAYSELDEDQDEILPSGTRTRKVKTKAEKKQMPNFSSLKNKKRKLDKTSASSKRPKKEEQFEVEAIAGMRETKGRVEYKVRWKNWGPKYDSWLPEEELSCPEILNKFQKTLDKLEKQENWQVENIISSREYRGKMEFLIRWKGFDSKCDTWEPRENLEGCQNLVDKFFEQEEKDKLAKSVVKARSTKSGAKLNKSKVDEDEDEEEKLTKSGAKVAKSPNSRTKLMFEEESDKEEENLAKSVVKATPTKSGAKLNKSKAEEDEEEEKLTKSGAKVAKSPNSRTKLMFEEESDKEEENLAKSVVKAKSTKSGAKLNKSKAEEDEEEEEKLTKSGAKVAKSPNSRTKLMFEEESDKEEVKRTKSGAKVAKLINSEEKSDEEEEVAKPDKKVRKPEKKTRSSDTFVQNIEESTRSRSKRKSAVTTYSKDN